jgi:type IV secretion system protein TrbL
MSVIPTASHLVTATSRRQEGECEGIDIGCRITNPGETVGDIVGSTAGAAAEGIVDQVAQSFAKAAIETLKTLMTWWVDIPSGKIVASSPSDPVYFVQSHTGWLASAAAVFGLLLAAGRIAWQRRGDAFRDALSGLVTMVLATFIGAAAVNLAVLAGDSYSEWILEASTQGDVQGVLGRAGTLFGAKLLPNQAGTVFILAILAILSSVIQMGMMLIRGAMLVLLTGMLPIAGAMAVTPDGRAMFKKMMGWLIAYVLYKPVAATVYAVAFKSMMGNSLSQLQGLMLIILAVIALPALMRLIVPLVAAVGSGGGGGIAGAAMTGAMGAQMVGATGGGGGGGRKGGGKSGGGKSGKGEGDGPKGSKQASSGKGEGVPRGADQSVGRQPTGQPAAGGSSSTAAATGGPYAAAAAAAAAANAAKGAAENAADGDGDGPRGSN